MASLKLSNDSSKLSVKNEFGLGHTIFTRLTEKTKKILNWKKTWKIIFSLAALVSVLLVTLLYLQIYIKILLKKLQA